MLATMSAFLGGSFVGICMRYGVLLAAAGLGGALFPWGTLVLNTVGGLLVGVCFELHKHGLISEPMRILLIPGFLGAMTTFSAYSLETISLLSEGRWVAGISNIVLNNGLALMCVVAGIWLIRLIKGLG